MLQLAETYNVPALEIRVSLKDGQPSFEESWHRRERFAAPTLPQVLANLALPKTSDEEALPGVSEFCGVAKLHVSARARRHSKLFSGAALAVIATHILATLCATVALAGHGAEGAAGPSAGRLVERRTAGRRTRLAVARLFCSPLAASRRIRPKSGQSPACWPRSIVPSPRSENCTCSLDTSSDFGCPTILFPCWHVEYSSPAIY